MTARWMGLLLLALLAACSSTPNKSDAELREAAETNTALGRQYMERGQHEVALEKLKRAVAYDKTYAPAHSMLAILYETIGEAEQAGEEYRLAVKYDPQGGEVNNNYGAFLCGSGKQQEAEHAVHQRLVEIDRPDDGRSPRGDRRNEQAQHDQQRRADQRDQHQPDRRGQLAPAFIDIAEQGRQRDQAGGDFEQLHERSFTCPWAEFGSED